MPTIRAIALHVPVKSWDVPDISRHIVTRMEQLINGAKVHALNAWTFRVVLPPLGDCVQACDVNALWKDLSSVFGNTVLLSLPLEGGHPLVNNVLRMLEEGLYASVRCVDEVCLKKVYEHVYARYREYLDKLDVFTQFAIVFGTWPETPYFPATANAGNVLGLSASLRYADALSRCLREKKMAPLYAIVNELEGKVRALSDSLSIPFLGLDLSLSPWLIEEESVGGLVEWVVGGKIGSPGTFSAIHFLNEIIAELGRSVASKTIGFNEVMLSVAEDLVLSTRAGEGALTLRDLISYSLVCAVGLDMAALPREVSIEKVGRDVLTAWKVKGRTVVMRVIPSDLPPGAQVTLRRFGKTYALKP